MKVSELIDELSKADPNLPVILSCDPEGNGYETLYTVDSEMHWHPQDKEVYSNEDIEDDEEVNTNDFERCVVLWP